MPMTLYAGAAEADITPAPGLPMDGYAARSGVSAGAHDPLLAQVLVLAESGRRAAVVALDALAVSATFALPLRRRLAVLLATEPDAVLICPSHTHCGPAGLQDWFPPGSAPPINAQLAEDVAQRVAAAAQQALSNLEPTRLSWRAGPVSDIGGDRNWRGQAADTQVTVLRFDREGGAPLAFVCHYACHPTILGPQTLLYSADFPGVLRRRLREAYPQSVCLYLNGAAGDISTRDFRREQTFTEVERLGALLAQQALRLPEIPVSAAPALSWETAEVDLPLRALDSQPTSIAATGTDRRSQAQAEGAAVAAQLAAAFRGQTSVRATLNALRVSGWTLLGVPGEPFSALAARVRAASSQALVVGYANDYLGYFPTQQAIDAQTYEALSSPYDARALDAIAAQLIRTERHSAAT